MAKPKKATKRYSEEFLLNLLKKIETGKISVNVVGMLDDSQSGIIKFITSSNWVIAVFIDCGQWDYIESISHGGHKITFDQINKFYPKIDTYGTSLRPKGWKFWRHLLKK